MDAINDNIKLQQHICRIVWYIILMHSFVQYQIIFLHYCCAIVINEIHINDDH